MSEFVGSEEPDSVQSSNVCVFLAFCPLVAGTGVSVPRNDGCCRDVLQKESTSGVPTGQLEWEALESVEASSACIGCVHGECVIVVIVKT